MLAYDLEHFCSYSAQFQNPPEVIGACSEGIRVNFYVTSGEVTGPKIRGVLRPVGGDWLTLRTDGVGLLDVHATIETHDGAIVYMPIPATMPSSSDKEQAKRSCKAISASPRADAIQAREGAARL